MFSSKFLYLFSVLSLVVSPAVAVTVRINQLGDSITGSPGCWRALLWQKLQAAGITNTDFVGTLPGQGCGFTYDGENDGHGGYLATGIVSNNQLPGWLAQSKPDIVTMMLGTNDVWSHLPTTTILKAFSTLVAQMRAQNPKMVIIVAQILPMNPSSCTDCGAGVVALNAAIPAWAKGISTSMSPVTVVDLWTGFVTGTDTGDGVHPNDAGNAKIATAWFPVLSAAIKKFGMTMPTTMVTKTTMVPTTMVPTTMMPTTLAPTTTTTKPTTTSASTRWPSPSNFCAAIGCQGYPLYYQCDGIGWVGLSHGLCLEGVCHYVNEYYSQCLPA